MPITGFNELVEELKLMREQFKEQQERQAVEQLKRQQLETASKSYSVNYQWNNGNDSS